MNQEQLQAIRERVNKATTGPWSYDDYYHELHGPDIQTTYDMADVRVGKDDASFIAHAREDVPALLNEIERLRGALKRIATYNDGADALEDLEACQDIARQALAGESV